MDCAAAGAARSNEAVRSCARCRAMVSSQCTARGVASQWFGNAVRWPSGGCEVMWLAGRKKFAWGLTQGGGARGNEPALGPSHWEGKEGSEKSGEISGWWGGVCRMTGVRSSGSGRAVLSLVRTRPKCLRRIGCLARWPVAGCRRAPGMRPDFRSIFSPALERATRSRSWFRTW